MNKAQAKMHIKANYKNMEQIILLAKLESLKPGQIYGWKHETEKGTEKRVLMNTGRNYTIETIAVETAL